MIKWFLGLSRSYSILVGFMVIMFLGFVDYATGNELRLSLFYLGPIFFVAWTVSMQAGIIMSVVSASVEALTDFISGLSYSSPYIHYWNAAIETLFFVIGVLIISALKAAYEKEQLLARQDFLTGIANTQAFFDVVSREIERCRRYRHPLTLAYIDCDNFKVVNDTFGHQGGDEVLRAVAMTLRNHIRLNDIVARIGGDEFAVFLPETGAEPAERAFRKIRDMLLDAMRTHNWPITFSIGIATFITPPESCEVMLKEADALMYSVKKGGKDTIRHEIF